MGAAGRRGAFGVTLQFALAMSARGFCVTWRELNLAHRRRQAPWLLDTASEPSLARRLRAVLGASTLVQRQLAIMASRA